MARALEELALVQRVEQVGRHQQHRRTHDMTSTWARLRRSKFCTQRPDERRRSISAVSLVSAAMRERQRRADAPRHARRGEYASTKASSIQGVTRLSRNVHRL